MIVTDPKSGIAIRFTKQFECRSDNPPTRIDMFVDENTAAAFVASRDDRDIPFEDKLRDALAKVRSMPIVEI